jgi:hypothetical protein
MLLCAVSTQRLPRINGSYSIRKKIIDRNSKISASYVLVKSWVSSRARLTHNYYWSPPIVCHFPPCSLLNTNVRRGAINEKSIPANNLNRVAETESAKRIPIYTPVLYGILVFRIEVLDL